MIESQVETQYLGAVGHLASAATVAASSFNMKLIDPGELLAAIDSARWEKLRRACINSDTRLSKCDLA